MEVTTGVKFNRVLLYSAVEYNKLVQRTDLSNADNGITDSKTTNFFLRKSA